MSAELLRVLLESALATSAAMLAVLVLRLPVRHVFGARVAYALWTLVPVALVAVMLPSRTIEVAAVADGGARVGEITTQASAAGIDFAPWLLIAWCLGAFVLALSLMRNQRRFRAELGALHPRGDGSWHSQSARIGPAVIGALRGRVVVPADFESRYDAAERDLVLRHERVHVARFDLAANLVATALRCVHWFNPLQHYASGRFRFDQELAADAAVLAQRPQSRREYADAMLKTQLLLDPPPLGCHWQPAHPLKERILMLKHPLPGAVRATLGVSLAFALSLGTGYVAWASQPARLSEAAPMPAPTSGAADATPISYARLAPPKYPADAAMEKVAGTVMLRVLVGIEGAPERVKVETSSGDARLDQAAVTKVRRDWRFNPPKQNGEPVTGEVLVPITFSLDGPPTDEEAVPAAANQLDEIYIAPKQ